MLGRVALVLAALVSTASADPGQPADPERLVLVNATTKLGDFGQISWLRHALDNRGLLFKLPAPLEATLDQRNVLIADLAAIRESYGSADYAGALQIIEDDQVRILENAGAGDPAHALAELSQWRGMIAAAQNQQDDAIKWFRAAHRLDPAQALDSKLPPRVRAMAVYARREVEATGFLTVEATPDDASISIDGGQRRHDGRIKLPVGVHLVTVTADDHATHAELIDLQRDQPYKIVVALEDATAADRAARLVDATVSAPPGSARLQRAKALSQLTGASRLLVVEDGGEDHVSVRLYDVSQRKVSKPIELEDASSSAAIARKIAAALDPENVQDMHVRNSAPESHWYDHWYVWAGAAALAAGGGVAGYEMMAHGL